MKQISTFEEFEAAVINEAKTPPNMVAGSGGALVGGMMGAAMVPVGPLGGAGIFTALTLGNLSINLNNQTYLNYLETEYKQRFEENKHDSQYIQSLIKEAVNKIRTLV